VLPVRIYFSTKPGLLAYKAFLLLKRLRLEPQQNRFEPQEYNSLQVSNLICGWQATIVYEIASQRLAITEWCLLSSH
jgi:hypothetical protein